MQANSAPVAVNRRQGPSSVKFSTKKLGNRTKIVMSCSDLLFNGSNLAGAHAAGSQLYKVRLNPNYWVGTRVALMAPEFEKFRVTKAIVEAVSVNSTQINGSIVGFVEYDPTSTDWTPNIGVLGLQRAAAHPGRNTTNVWSNLKVTYNLDPKQTDLFLSTTGADPRAWEAGDIYIYAETDVPDTYAGHDIYLHWELELDFGNVEANALGGSSAEARSNIGVYNASAWAAFENTLSDSMALGSFPARLLTLSGTTTSMNVLSQVWGLSKGSRFTLSIGALSIGAGVCSVTNFLTSGPISSAGGSNQNAGQAGGAIWTGNFVVEEDLSPISDMTDPATIQIQFGTTVAWASTTVLFITFAALSSDGAGNYSLTKRMMQEKHVRLALYRDQMLQQAQQLKDARDLARKKRGPTERKAELIARELERLQREQDEEDRLAYGLQEEEEQLRTLDAAMHPAPNVAASTTTTASRPRALPSLQIVQPARGTQ